MKYKHLKTQKIATLGGLFYCVEGNLIPRWIVEKSSDWELLSPDEIISFRHELCNNPSTKGSLGTFRFDFDDGPKHYSLISCLSNDAITIYSVKIGDEVFSIGDKIGSCVISEIVIENGQFIIKAKRKI